MLLPSLKRIRLPTISPVCDVASSGAGDETGEAGFLREVRCWPNESKLEPSSRMTTITTTEKLLMELLSGTSPTQAKAYRTSHSCGLGPCGPISVILVTVSRAEIICPSHVDQLGRDFDGTALECTHVGHTIQKISRLATLHYAVLSSILIQKVVDCFIVGSYQIGRAHV